MSRLQSKLHKAIEKSRKSADRSPGDSSGSVAESIQSGMDSIASSIVRMLHVAKPRDDVMEERRIIAAIDDQAVRSSYNVLRTRILQRLRSNDWHSILVTSAGPSEGKTLTAANLAMSIARDVNQSAVLVDLDLMRSSIARYLGINTEIEAGIGDFLAGDAELSDILYSPEGMERLALIPNREPVDNSSDLLGSPRMKELVTWLGGQPGKTVVIYDMPPVHAHDDVLAFCPNVDAILLVVAQGQTDRAALEQAMDLLSDYEMLGVVMNMSDERSAEGGYGYY